MQEMNPPRSTAEMLEALKDQNSQLIGYFEAIPLEEFFSPQKSFWSPSEHLRHLNKSVRPLAKALRLPKTLLLIRFGPSWRSSRTFEELRDFYRAALAAGATAGPYSPSSQTEDRQPEEWRQEIIGHWRKNAEAFEDAAGAWGELALDRARLPHPLLGKLTVREMILWTLYHNQHHLLRVEERRAKDAFAPGP